ncbi:unnamed protein product [Alopecurus aequalis]
MADAGDLHRWVASAVALTRLPAVGSEVYYFPQGHAEQWSLAAPAAAQPRVICTVDSIELFPAGDEPYARVSLTPANHDNPPVADPRADADIFVYYRKVLPYAEIQRAFLHVPKKCGESLLPMFEDGSSIPMSDVRGHEYVFQYSIGLGQKRELRAAWGNFVGDKGLKVDDSVLLIRRSTDQRFFIEARRQHPPVNHALQPPQHELAESSLLANEGAQFTVTYYPGKGFGSPFVVPRGAVEEAMGKHWEAGMDVRLRAKDVVVHAESPQGARQLQVITGRINTVRNAAWRHLQVIIDPSGAASNLNAWEVDVVVGAQPPAAKRRRSIRLLGFDIIAICL